MKKLYIIIALLLTLTATAQPVRVPYSCGEGNAFTIRIPIRLPANTSVEYVWYKNGAEIAGTRTALTKNITAIAYTIPANEAFGDSVAYHFEYSVYKVGCSDCEEWLSSPLYVVRFTTCDRPQASAIIGDTTVCAGASRLAYSVAPVAGASYAWNFPAGWRVTAGRYSSTVTVTADTAAGAISVELGNSCGFGAPRTLAVSTVKLRSPGVIDFGVAACSGGVSTPGVISFEVFTCGGDGVSSAGVIDFAASPCSGGVSDAGTISFAAY
jgi:hypothetical protein